MPALRWDLFCHVVDNFGDVGVCWRLAAQLGARGDRVRLVIDDPSALAWMAPSGAPGVEVVRWADAGRLDPAEVVIEAFGCDPPPGFVAAMSRAATPPVWINLEYLSAEDYVERSHGLPSPQPGGLVKWFFFPGFTTRTGGLLREEGLLEVRARFDRDAWLRALAIERRPGERVVSLFSYENPRLPDLLRDLAAAPTLLLLAQGPAQERLTRGDAAPPGLRLHPLPWLDQPGFDRLLWSSELNFVRGEDSLVRALWAGAPFVWMAYPQHDEAHRAKLEALLARAALPPAAADLLRAWNGFAPWPPWPRSPARPGLPDVAPGGRWAAAVRQWRATLGAQPDLATQLRRFALARRDSSRPPGQPGSAC